MGFWDNPHKVQAWGLQLEERVASLERDVSELQRKLVELAPVLEELQTSLLLDQQNFHRSMKAELFQAQKEFEEKATVLVDDFKKLLQGAVREA